MHISEFPKQCKPGVMYNVLVVRWLFGVPLVFITHCIFVHIHSMQCNVCVHLIQTYVYIYIPV